MRRSKAEWTKEIALWRESGLTAREYAAKAKLNAGTLAYWKYALARDERSTPARRTKACTTGRGAGSPVFPIIEVRGRGRSDDGFEIELVTGHRVRVPAAFDAEALRRLLATLEGPA